ncbi:trigger factor [uncultured Parvibaculum sp.]|uniref:trigger factor n=1 Tax=uncultured Parvibaculum sp. TaxID=291828 RepID=UPI0030DA730F
MQVTVTNTDGLKRELKIQVPAQDLEARLGAKLEEMKNQVRLKGFRPGKVPVSHLRKTFGKQVMGEIIQEAVGESSQKALADEALRPAFQPSIDLEGEIQEVMDGKADLTFKMSFEVVPTFDLADFSKVSVERLVAEVKDADIDEALKRLAENQKNFEPRAEGAKAEDGDLLTIDFVGKIDGVAFDGGSAEDANLELGSGRFIPGFEEQLVGVKVGDEKTVNVTFPAEYGAEQLAGKDAVFDVKVKEVKAPAEVAIDDELAKRFGFDALDKLREALAEQIKSDYTRMSRAHMKRAMLDKLDELHDFELPPSMVEQEFEQIWQQFQHELSHQNKTADDLDEPEDEVKAEYRKIAERRVRLGLVLAEVGEKNSISVTEQELSQALAERARQFPGQERQLYQYYQQNPQAVQELRAPIFEDKVVDFIAELADVTDKPVSRDELFADPDAEEHVHDENCDHDHDHDHGEAKPAKKAAAKKPAAKKPATKKKKED